MVGTKQTAGATGRSPDVTNHELLLYAIWTAGGTGRFIEVEEVYERAWRISPKRFGWRTRPYPSDYVADRALRTILRDPSLSPRLLVSGNRQALQLTAEGVAWVEANRHRFEHRGAGAVGPHGRGAQPHLRALERDPLVQAFAAGDAVSAGRAKFADLLRLTPDADGRAWRERLESYRSEAQATGRELVLAFCQRLEGEHAEWFGERK